MHFRSNRYPSLAGWAQAFALAAAAGLASSAGAAAQTTFVVEPARHYHEITAGVDSIIRDSAFVRASGPDSANVVWTSETFTPRIRMETSGGTGSGVVRWRTLAGTLPPGALPGYIIVRSAAPATNITIYDTLMVHPAAGSSVGFSRPAWADSLTVGESRVRMMNLVLTGPGADSVAWTASVSSPRLVLDTVSGVGSKYFQYRRSAAGVAPGLYVDTVRITLTATGYVAAYVDSAFVVAVPTPLVIVSDSIRPAGTMGAGFSDGLQATGGTGGVRWSVSEGALPPGIAIDSTTGALAGVPEADGVFAARITARVTAGSASGETTTRGFAFTIVEPTLTDAAVIEELMDGSGLDDDERRYLDLLGNRNGRVDIGDVSVWLEAH